MRRNIPNLISAYRVFAAGAICFFAASNRWIPALVLCMVGFASDLLDGIVARALGNPSPDDGFGKWLDVFGDRTIIIAPVLGAAIAGNFPDWAAALVMLWVALMYSTEHLFLRVVDAANAALWFSGYIVTGWQAIEHLGWGGAAPFLALTALFMALGALSHTELVGRGIRQAGVKNGS